jgi:hypothetical protein
VSEANAALFVETDKTLFGASLKPAPKKAKTPPASTTTTVVLSDSDSDEARKGRKKPAAPPAPAPAPAPKQVVISDSDSDNDDEQNYFAGSAVIGGGFRKAAAAASSSSARPASIVPRPAFSKASPVRPRIPSPLPAPAPADDDDNWGGGGGGGDDQVYDNAMASPPPQQRPALPASPYRLPSTTGLLLPMARLPAPLPLPLPLPPAVTRSVTIRSQDVQAYYTDAQRQAVAREFATTERWNHHLESRTTRNRYGVVATILGACAIARRDYGTLTNDDALTTLAQRVARDTEMPLAVALLPADRYGAALDALLSNTERESHARRDMRQILFGNPRGMGEFMNAEYTLRYLRLLFGLEITRVRTNDAVFNWRTLLLTERPHLTAAAGVAVGIDDMDLSGRARMVMASNIPPNSVEGPRLLRLFPDLLRCYQLPLGRAALGQSFLLSELLNQFPPGTFDRNDGEAIDTCSFMLRLLQWLREAINAYNTAADVTLARLEVESMWDRVTMLRSIVAYSSDEHLNQDERRYQSQLEEVASDMRAVETNNRMGDAEKAERFEALDARKQRIMDRLDGVYRSRLSHEQYEQWQQKQLKDVVSGIRAVRSSKSLSDELKALRFQALEVEKQRIVDSLENDQARGHPTREQALANLALAEHDLRVAEQRMGVALHVYNGSPALFVDPRQNNAPVPNLSHSSLGDGTMDLSVSLLSQLFHQLQDAAYMVFALGRFVFRGACNELLSNITVPRALYVAPPPPPAPAPAAAAYDDNTVLFTPRVDEMDEYVVDREASQQSPPMPTTPQTPRPMERRVGASRRIGNKAKPVPLPSPTPLELLGQLMDEPLVMLNAEIKPSTLYNWYSTQHTLRVRVDSKTKQTVSIQWPLAVRTIIEQWPTSLWIVLDTYRAGRYDSGYYRAGEFPQDVLVCRVAKGRDAAADDVEQVVVALYDRPDPTVPRLFSLQPSAADPTLFTLAPVSEEELPRYAYRKQLPLARSQKYGMLVAWDTPATVDFSSLLVVEARGLFAHVSMYHRLVHIHGMGSSLKNDVLARELNSQSRTPGNVLRYDRKLYQSLPLLAVSFVWRGADKSLVSSETLEARGLESLGVDSIALELLPNSSSGKRPLITSVLSPAKKTGRHLVIRVIRYNNNSGGDSGEDAKKYAYYYAVRVVGASSLPVPTGLFRLHIMGTEQTSGNTEHRSVVLYVGQLPSSKRLMAVPVPSSRCVFVRDNK